MKCVKNATSLPACVGCLYAVGFGIKRIVRHTGYAKTTVGRFLKTRAIRTDAESERRKKAEDKRRKGMPQPSHLQAIERTPAGWRPGEMTEAWDKEWRGMHWLGELKHWKRHPALVITKMDRYYADHERSKADAAASAKARYYLLRHTPAWKAKQFARNQLARIKRQALGFAKKGRSHEYLGCTYQYAADYITALLPVGWTWANHGSVWHIDHKIQLSDGDLTDDMHIMNVCHYTNLRPLHASINLTRPKGCWRGKQKYIAA